MFIITALQQAAKHDLVNKLEWRHLFLQEAIHDEEVIMERIECEYRDRDDHTFVQNEEYLDAWHRYEGLQDDRRKTLITIETIKEMPV